MPAAREHLIRWQHYWDRHAHSYDKHMRFMDRVLFGDSRRWACSHASGKVLEIAIGTGLNLPLYPAEVTVTGVDLSQAMLDIARTRATGLDRPVELRQADAAALPFGDATFDTAVCTLGLCAIPDIDRALGEMHRVVRPGGHLVLVDHVASSAMPVRAIQKLLELVTISLAGEHFLRRPSRHLPAAGWEIESSERFTLGLVERLHAHKPAGI